MHKTLFCPRRARLPMHRWPPRRQLRALQVAATSLLMSLEGTGAGESNARPPDKQGPPSAEPAPAAPTQSSWNSTRDPQLCQTLLQCLGEQHCLSVLFGRVPSHSAGGHSAHRRYLAVRCADQHPPPQLSSADGRLGVSPPHPSLLGTDTVRGWVTQGWGL